MSPPFSQTALAGVGDLRLAHFLACIATTAGLPAVHPKRFPPFAQPPSDAENIHKADDLDRNQRTGKDRTGICRAAEARIIGPVHGRKFTPAANEAAQARSAGPC